LISEKAGAPSLSRELTRGLPEGRGKEVEKKAARIYTNFHPPLLQTKPQTAPHSFGSYYKTIVELLPARSIQSLQAIAG